MRKNKIYIIILLCFFISFVLIGCNSSIYNSEAPSNNTIDITELTSIDDNMMLETESLETTVNKETDVDIEEKVFYIPEHHIPIEFHTVKSENTQKMIDLYKELVEDIQYETLYIKPDGTAVTCAAVNAPLSLTTDEYCDFLSWLIIYYGDISAAESAECVLYYDGNDEFIECVLYVYRSTDKYIEKRNLMMKEIDNVLTGFSEGPDFMILRQICEWVKENVKYETGYLNASDAIFEHKASCTGIALLTNLMAERAGIATDLYIGLTGEGEEAHCWNAVLIDDFWYEYDVTFYAMSGDTKWIEQTTPFHNRTKINDFYQ